MLKSQIASSSSHVVSPRIIFSTTCLYWLAKSDLKNQASFHLPCWLTIFHFGDNFTEFLQEWAFFYSRLLSLKVG